MASASVPLPVKATSSGSDLSKAAPEHAPAPKPDQARAPKEWPLERFPKCSVRYGRIAASTRGSGVVAL
jgi:hypothetical protein